MVKNKISSKKSEMATNEAEKEGAFSEIENKIVDEAGKRLKWQP